ncbi:MAG: tyrosine--tRNA ligase [Maricaulaceae bacterium]|nr:tyrosine--tRNA ligase [Maricaulaceae bacterium]
MSDYKSDLVRTLVERGYLYQATDIEGLDAAAAKGPVTGYIGFDATASSLHVGSLVQIMMLRRMQQAGHTPIILFGGGTSKIGDPSGKDKSRSMLSHEQIQANKDGILQPFGKLLDMGKAVVADNDDWLSQFGYLDFLREYGTHFTINRMLTFDSVKSRLEREQPLTFLEFNYMLLQAVDFLELSRRHGCALQLGGADQWGNIVNGVELCRRVDGKEVFGFTTPLITTASGAKMGKTAEGAVWLNADMRSPYDYWQFWRNTEDADVGRFLRLFTDLPLAEIARLEALQGAEINEAKIVLANTATAMLHREPAAKQAEEAAKAAFVEGRLSANLPTVDLIIDKFPKSRTTAALVYEAKLTTSMKEAKRKIAEGAVRINDERITESRDHTYGEVLADVRAFKVQLGKRIVLLKPVKK